MQLEYEDISLNPKVNVQHKISPLLPIPEQYPQCQGRIQQGHVGRLAEDRQVGAGRSKGVSQDRRHPRQRAGVSEAAGSRRRTERGTTEGTQKEEADKQRVSACVYPATNQWGSP